MIEYPTIVAAEVAVIDHRHAIGNIGCAAKHHAADTPGWRPCREAPAEAGVDAERNSYAKRNTGADDDSRRRHHCNPCGPSRDKSAPHHPGIVVRHVHHRRIHGRDSDHAVGYSYRFLGRARQFAVLLGLRAHRLNRILHVTGLIEISIAELRSPGRVLSHVVENGRKFNERFDGGIPRLRIGARGALGRRQIHILNQPGVGSPDLIRISRAGQDRSHQRIRIECNGGHQLIQLIRVQLHVRRSRRLRVQIDLYRGDQGYRKHHCQQLAGVVEGRRSTVEVHENS